LKPLFPSESQKQTTNKIKMSIIIHYEKILIDLLLSSSMK